MRFKESITNRSNINRMDEMCKGNISFKTMSSLLNDNGFNTTPEMIEQWKCLNDQFRERRLPRAEVRNIIEANEALSESPADFMLAFV